MLSLTLESRIVLHCLSKREVSSVLISMWYRCCPWFKTLCYSCDVFVVLQGCYEHTLPLRRGENVFSYLRKSSCFLSHGWNVIMGCGGHVIVVKWSKRWNNNWKFICFLSYIGEMFTSPSQSNVMVVGRKVLVVLEKECHLGQLEEMCLHVTTKMVFQPHGRNALLVLQKKCYFGHMVQMCSRVTNEMLRAPHDCTLSSS